MNITEITNKHIKIGKTSITVVNEETGKTCGLVRNVFKWKELQPRRKMEFAKQVRPAFVSNIDGILDAVIVDGNDLYYLNDLKPYEFYEKHYKDESDIKYLAKRDAIIEAMKEHATIIDCYIDKY